MEALELRQKLEGRELSDVLKELEGLKEAMKKEGLYFIAHCDEEHLIFVSDVTEKLIVDVQQIHNWDVVVTRTENGLVFRQDDDTGMQPYRYEDYYAAKTGLNLIKVDTPSPFLLETTFKSELFTIFINGKRFGAVIFKENAIK